MFSRGPLVARIFSPKAGFLHRGDAQRIGNPEGRKKAIRYPPAVPGTPEPRSFDAFGNGGFFRALARQR